MTNTNSPSWDTHNPVTGRAYSSDALKILQKRQTLPCWARKEEFLDIMRKNQVMVLVGETGSGKTVLAYMLPMLQHLAVDPATQSLKRVDRHLGGTRAVLLCPTRELATQSTESDSSMIENAALK